MEIYSKPVDNFFRQIFFVILLDRAQSFVLRSFTGGKLLSNSMPDVRSINSSFYHGYEFKSIRQGFSKFFFTIVT